MENPPVGNADLPGPPKDAIADLQERFQLIEIPPCPAPVQSFDGSGPRLIITKLVVENFKSYGTRNELGPFCKNFNCIVGPNGSGKSNVIDALLFVFGYRATKIRSKKINSLIHNSQLLPNMPFCRVEVHFQNILDTGPGCMDFKEVQDSGFVISRSGYQDNTATYHINGSKATTTQVKDKLIGHGIDLTHNRFLILQGEVEQISLMPPKATGPHEEGLLEYLEDIIGSSRFKEPLVTLEQRIETLNELRQEKVNRLKVVEREKKELEGVRNQALDYLREINKLNAVKNVFFQKHKYRCKCEEKKLRTDLAKTEEGLNELRVTKRELDAKHEAASEEFKVLQTAYEDRDKTYHNHKALFQEIEVEDTKLRDEFKHKRSEVTKLKQLLQGIDKKLEEMGKLPEEAQKSMETLTRKMTALQEEKVNAEETYHAAMENLRKATEPLAQEKTVKEKELNELQKVTDAERGKLELVQSRLDILQSNHAKAEQKYDQVKSEHVRLDQGLTEKRKSLQQLEEVLPKQSSTLANMERDLAAARKRESDLIQELKVKRCKVQEMRSNLEQRTGKDRVLESLLEQRRLGRLPGVIGRLGDLGRIDAKYDIAISTACSNLDHIVTDTMDTAQACVQYLKDNNVGFATFTALDKMESQRQYMERRHPTPEDAPRLFDFIHFNEDRFKTAFYFGLRDTLVATNSTEATRWAYGKQQRFRVVTLDGMLIETTGTLSGGGNRPSRGKMQLLNSRNSSANQMDDDVVDPRELENLELSVAEKSKEMQVVQETRTKLEDAHANTHREVEHMRRQHSTLKQEVSQLSQQMNSMESNIRIAEQRMESSKPDAAEIKRLKDDVNKLEKSHSKALKASEAAKAAVDALSKQIEEKGQILLSSPKLRLENVETALKEATEKVNKVSVSLKTAERNVKKAEEQKEAKQKQLEDTRQALTELQDNLTKMATVASEHLDKYQEALKERDVYKEQMTEKTTEIEAMNAAFEDLNRRVSEVKHSIEQAKEKVEEKSREVRRWNREIGQLKFTRILEDEEEAQLQRMQEEESQSQMDVTLSQDVANRTQTTEKDDDGEEEEDSEPEPISLEQLLSSRPPGKLTRDYSLPVYKGRELECVVVRQEDIDAIDARIQAMNPNMAAIEEYRVKEQAYMIRVAELSEVNRLRDTQLQQQSQFKQQRLHEFLSGFRQITDKLKEMYQMITLGGDAELELVDSLDPFSEGVVFSVRPPNKSWKCISNLSGGEKTLSSLALVFALHHYKPTPLYVMDEIDAALDFKNVSIVANYVKDRTKNAQFIIISLRNNMFELGNRLVGIYKTYDCSFTCTVDLNAIVEPNLQRAIADHLGVDPNWLGSNSMNTMPFTQFMPSSGTLVTSNTNRPVDYHVNRDQMAHETVNAMKDTQFAVPNTPHFSRHRQAPPVQSTPMPTTSSVAPRGIKDESFEMDIEPQQASSPSVVVVPPSEETPLPPDEPMETTQPLARANSMEDLFHSMECSTEEA